MGDVPSPDPARIARKFYDAWTPDEADTVVLARAYLRLRTAAEALVADFDADTPIFTQQVYADLCAALAGGSR